MSGPGLPQAPPAPRGSARRARWRTGFLSLLLIQIVAGAWVYARGFPYFGTHLVSNAPLWEAPVTLWHLPGVVSLSLAGQCCGFGKSLVLGPKVVAGHVRVSLPGTLILCSVNVAVWAGLLALIGGLRWGVRSRRRIGVDESRGAASLDSPPDGPGG